MAAVIQDLLLPAISVHLRLKLQAMKLSYARFR